MKNLILITTLIFISCAKSNRVLEVFKSDLFSNRNDAKTQFIAIIKLQSPALLQKDGTVDEQAAKQVELEQTEKIAELQKISSEIKVIYRYRLVLNAIAVVAPISAEEALKKSSRISYIEVSQPFGRPTFIKNDSETTGTETDLTVHNSMTFIGANELYKAGIKGEGIRVGVIDTGIDYTHKMFLGPGSTESYANTNPDTANALFPNKKVVGGIDLVGTKYNAADDDFSKHIPLPDMNPLDEGEHGTHVAGTVAGIGDGINTYNGVAPAADLYAIKVFGADGSTSDIVVIAAFEYAADPNGDLNPSDRLDVINLSLGGDYGKPHVLYGEAVKNLTKAGTVTVASAGNSGEVPYIVGAPSTVDEAISVAASVDDMAHNILFAAAKFESKDLSISTQFVESAIAKQLDDVNELNGEIILGGIADTDYTEEQKAQIKGKILLIDRGVVTFGEKMKRGEEAGAICVIVANNKDDAPFSMGGEGKINIPAMMIGKIEANQIKEALKLAPVTVDFKKLTTIKREEFIDSLTDFSSRGPRSDDSAIKPEIAAPGKDIISAKMGAGDLGVKFSGTSMAGPHVAGVMALLSQAYPKVGAAALKSIVVQSAKTIGFKGERYDVAYQGSGRVELSDVLNRNLVFSPSTLSLGEHYFTGAKKIRKTITVENLGETEETVAMSVINTDLTVSFKPANFSLKAKSKQVVVVDFTFNPASSDDETENFSERDGLIKIISATKSYQIPFLAIENRASNLRAKFSDKLPTSTDNVGAGVDLKVQNLSPFKGDLLLFNRIGADAPKPYRFNEQFKSRACDLKSAGYRIITREGAEYLQFAMSFYQTLSVWQQCEASVVFDINGDRKGDYELGGVFPENLQGLAIKEASSVLVDMNEAKIIRDAARVAKTKVNYTAAVKDVSPLVFHPYSDVVILEVPAAAVRELFKSETVKIQLALLHEDGSVDESDDFLGSSAYRTLSLDANAQTFVGLPETTLVGPSSEETLMLLRVFVTPI
jgi:subtilisin family serine protease